MRFPQRFASAFVRASRRPVFPLVMALVALGIASDRTMRRTMGLFFESSEVRLGGFVILVLLAAAFSKHAIARIGFATVLMALMLVGSLKFGEKFPFESWKLYSKPAFVERSACFIDAVTASGRAYRLDDRVMGDFTTPTNHNRWGERVVSEMTPEQQKAFAHFVGERIQRYRQDRQAEEGGWRKWVRKLKFPPHQFGSRWDATVLAAMKEVTAIRIRVETIKLDGKNDWKPEVIDQKIVEVPCL